MIVVIAIGLVLVVGAVGIYFATLQNRLDLARVEEDTIRARTYLKAPAGRKVAAQVDPKAARVAAIEKQLTSAGVAPVVAREAAVKQAEREFA